MRQGFTLIELMIVIAIIAIIASIAIPNLLESRVSANEAAASSSLKSGVFSAEIQCQANGYQDADADNIGEFATLRVLAGLDATNKIGTNSIHLLQGQFAVKTNWSNAGAGSETDPALGTSNGYKYTSIVPANTDITTLLTTKVWAEGQALPASIADLTAETANQGESYFIASASPEKFGESGRRAFVITADGQVRSPSTAKGIGAFYGKTVTPDNGTAFDAKNIVKGMAYSINTTYTTCGKAAFDKFTSSENFTECPVFAK